MVLSHYTLIKDGFQIPSKIYHQPNFPIHFDMLDINSHSLLLLPLFYLLGHSNS